MPVKPPSPRHVVQEWDGALRIVIPSQKNWVAIVFLGCWLVGWAVGEFVALGMLSSGIAGLFSGDRGLVPDLGQGCGGAFMLVWLGGWTVGGAFALYSLLWSLAGRELIEVTHYSIVISRKIFSLGRRKEYLVHVVLDEPIDKKGVRTLDDEVIALEADQFGRLEPRFEALSVDEGADSLQNRGPNPG